MKIGGIEVEGPHEALLVLPRGQKMIPFRAQAILDYGPMNALLTEPLPPAVVKKGVKTLNTEDKGYIAQKLEYERRKMAWIIIESLRPSNIEWSTVDITKPSTWRNFETDLKAANFTVIEINRIIDLALEANNLDEKKLDWAREVFLQGQQASEAS